MSDRKTIFETGLKMEQEAQKQYSDLAEKVRDRGAKTMLKELAEDEGRHARLFQAALEGRVLEFGKAPSADIQDLGIGETLAPVTLTDRSEPQDVLIFAIHEEMKAFKLYNEWADGLAGTEFEPLLRAIAREEMVHKARLERIYDDEVLLEN